MEGRFERYLGKSLFTFGGAIYNVTQNTLRSNENNARISFEIFSSSEKQLKIRKQKFLD